MPNWTPISDDGVSMACCSFRSGLMLLIVSIYFSFLSIQYHCLSDLHLISDKIIKETYYNKHLMKC